MGSDLVISYMQAEPTKRHLQFSVNYYRKNIRQIPWGGGGGDDHPCSLQYEKKMTLCIAFWVDQHDTCDTIMFEWESDGK